MVAEGSVGSHDDFMRGEEGKAEGDIVVVFKDEKEDDDDRFFWIGLCRAP